MVCQEDLFDFFQTISVELEREGYPILDNIIHPFPTIKFREDIIKEERVDQIDSDESLSEDDDSGNKKSKEEV
tara:strand:- start:361 stop:579 length:219 start_codon:yes stop_codon:yes gene_type:complete